MKPIPSGRYKRTLKLEDFAIQHNSCLLYSTSIFSVLVDFHYEREWKPLEDDPGAPEYAELISATLLEDVTFAWDDDYSQSLKKGEDLLPHTTETQRVAMADMIIAQGREERYCDPDNYRPKPNERIRRELGWGLNTEYGRDAS